MAIENIAHLHYEQQKVDGGWIRPKFHLIVQGGPNGPSSNRESEWYLAFWYMGQIGKTYTSYRVIAQVSLRITDDYFAFVIYGKDRYTTQFHGPKLLPEAIEHSPAQIALNYVYQYVADHLCHPVWGHEYAKEIYTESVKRGVFEK